MFARIRIVAAIFVVFTFSNSPAQTRLDPPPSAQHISGRIVDQSGAPLSGQVVNLRVVDTGSPNMVTTAQDGRFAFSGRGHMPYELYVPAKDFTFKEVSTFVVADVHDVDFGDVSLQFLTPGNPIVRIAGPLKVTASRTDENMRTASSRPSRPRSILALYTSCSATSANVCDHSTMHIVTGDGLDVLAPEETTQVGVRSPTITEDGGEGGWLILSDFCCTSYPIPLALIVYRPGKPPRRFESGRAIERWHFVAQGKQVAFSTDFLHGNSAPEYELRDVETGRVVATWEGEITNNAPRWTRP